MFQIELNYQLIKMVRREVVALTQKELRAKRANGYIRFHVRFTKQKKGRLRVEFLDGKYTRPSVVWTAKAARAANPS